MGELARTTNVDVCLSVYLAGTHLVSFVTDRRSSQFRLVAADNMACHCCWLVMVGGAERDKSAGRRIEPSGLGPHPYRTRLRRRW